MSESESNLSSSYQILNRTQFSVFPADDSKIVTFEVKESYSSEDTLRQPKILTKLVLETERQTSQIDRSLLNINHENLVKFFSSFVDGDKCLNLITRKYEYSLHNVLMDQSSFFLGRNEILLYFIQLVEAVEHLHSKNIFHSCIHLKNIFIHRNVLKLGGYHYCELLSDKNETFDVNSRILCYRCPEDRIGLKYDVWCIGAILYEMCQVKCQIKSLSSNRGRLAPIEELFSDFSDWDQKINNIGDTIKQFSDLKPFKHNFKMFIKLDPSERVDLTQFFTNLRTHFKENYLTSFDTHKTLQTNLNQFVKDFNDSRGRYSIESVIGNGGFGRVFRIKDKQDSECPIKALKRIQTDKIKDYNDFKLHLKIINREKNILRQLSADNNTQQHPNVIKFFDEIKFNDYTCLITEYCPNGDLHELFSKKRMKNEQIEIKLQISYAVQLLCGLKYMHSQSIIHRDIKPSNLVLTDNYTNIKYSDFGLSIQSDMTSICQSILGTYIYLAPEMNNGLQYDNKIDVWALGCVFYEIGSLELAFSEAKQIDLRAKITNLAENSPNLNPDHPLHSLIEKMLRKDPSRRLDSTSLYKEARTIKANSEKQTE